MFNSRLSFAATRTACSPEIQYAQKRTTIFAMLSPLIMNGLPGLTPRRVSDALIATGFRERLLPTSLDAFQHCRVDDPFQHRRNQRHVNRRKPIKLLHVDCEPERIAICSSLRRHQPEAMHSQIDYLSERLVLEQVKDAGDARGLAGNDERAGVILFIQP